MPSPPDPEVIDGAGSPAPQAPVARPPSRSVLDCGPGGCGPGGFGGYGAAGGWAGGLGTLLSPGLDRTTIDDAMTDSLMRTIVTAKVDDALKVRPTLAGDNGEASSVLDYLDEKGYAEAQKMALTYARMYGGGGIFAIVDDGRRADEEIDVLGIRSIRGFYALPKWYLVPYGSGSSRVDAAWYGPRIGRPEYYSMTPQTGFDAPPTRPAGSAAAIRALEEAAERAADVAGISGRDAPRMSGDIRQILSAGGTRVHRSRIIPWQHCDEMDLRLARWIPTWMGWGPGVIEGCIAAFLARRKGALRIDSIMRSVIMSTVTMSDLEHRLTTPDDGAAVYARLRMIQECLNYTDDALPMVATDTQNVFDSLTRNVAGIDKLVEAQRTFLLDVVDTPAVRLFGDSVGGMNGGSRDGEWRQWYDAVKAYEETIVWNAGALGGGMKQAVNMAMLCSRGPTRGRLDRTVKAVWPHQWSASERDKASARLDNSRARAQDRLTLELTPAALRRFDTDVAATYPGLDVDEGPLPVIAPAPAQGSTVPAGTTAAVADPTTGGEGAAEAAAAMTPGAVNEAVANEDDASAPPAPAPAPAPAMAVLPEDIYSVADIAAAMGMTKAAVSKIIAAAGIQPFLRTPPGTRGGDRYELGKVLAAWSTQSRSRADAMRRTTC